MDDDEYEEDDADNFFDDIGDEPQQSDKKYDGDDYEDGKDEGVKDDNDKDEEPYHLFPPCSNNVDLRSNIFLFSIRHKHYHHR